uniref:ITG-containing peptide n=1 Tax=Anopheles dirus TaxID=7168 RepID=A0A182NBL3_9DIPT
MKSPALWMAIGAILLLGGSVNAWGGLFNRFSPEMLANMGYGSHGGSYRPQTFLQTAFYKPIYHNKLHGMLPSFQNEILDEEQQSPRYEPDPCYPRACSANEYCCPGYICINTDGVVGICMPMYGRKYGELCRHDSDCESGLVCDISALSGASVCRPPTIVAKQYGEDCITSSDCDITR